MEDWFKELEDLDFSLVSHNRRGHAGTRKTTFQNEQQIIDEICELVDEEPSTVKSQIDDVRRYCNTILPSEDQFKLKDPPDINEILTTKESVITPSAHNVGIINAACQEVLKEMEQQLLALLKRNRKEQEIVQNYLRSNCRIKNTEVNKRPSIKCAGMPYFKDLLGYLPPLNRDVLRKTQNKKILPIDFIQNPPLWTLNDAKQLMISVNRTLLDSDPNFQTNKNIDPNRIDWMKISIHDMQNKYSPIECKSKWIMNLSPYVNKTKWSLKEFKSLNEIAKKYNYQNWDEIARELGTGRTAFQCCVQFQTHKPPKGGKWTKAEDEKLKLLIEKYQVRDYIPWQKVTWHFEERSLRQCQERFVYHLNGVKKGVFTMEEDIALVYLSTRLKNFGEVARYIPNRVSSQVRSRFEYLVNLAMPSFTKEEDELLTKLMVQYPRNWSKISEHFKNRSKLQCRRRWNTLQKKIKLDADQLANEKDEEDVERLCFLGDSTIHKNSIQKEIKDAANISNNLRDLSKYVIAKPRTKRFPEEYVKLLEYHKYCYKFLFSPKARLVETAEERSPLCKKMKVTMDNLSINWREHLPSFKLDSLSSNSEFNEEDMAILSELSKCPGSSCGGITSNKVLPPNFITLIGLRSLLLGWGKVRSLCSHYKEPSNDGSGHQIDPKDRIFFCDAKNLFKSRMKALFAFPLMLSKIPLDAVNATPVFKPKVRKRVKPISKLKRREKARMMSQAYRMKIKSDLTEKIAGKEGNDSSSKDNSEKEKSPVEIDKKKQTNAVKGSSGESAEANGESSSNGVTKRRGRPPRETGSEPKRNEPEIPETPETRKRRRIV